MLEKTSVEVRAQATDVDCDACVGTDDIARQAIGSANIHAADAGSGNGDGRTALSYAAEKDHA